MREDMRRLGTVRAVMVASLAVAVSFCAMLLTTAVSGDGEVISGGADMGGDGQSKTVESHPDDGAGEVHIVGGFFFATFGGFEGGDGFDGGDGGFGTMSGGSGGGGGEIPRIRLRGRNPGDRFGESVAILDDVNGNGALDLFIGAPRAGTSQRGEAYLFYGPFEIPPGQTELVINADDADVIFTSLFNNNVDFGRRVAPLYDLTGNGRPELRVQSTYTHSDNSEYIVTEVFFGDTGEPMFAVINRPASVNLWAFLPGDALYDQAVMVGDVVRVALNLGMEGEQIARFDGDLNADGIVNDVDLIEVLMNFGTLGAIVQVGSTTELPQPPEIGQSELPVLNFDDGMWYALTPGIPNEVPIGPGSPLPLRPLGPIIVDWPEIGDDPPWWWNDPGPGQPPPPSAGACCSHGMCTVKTSSECLAMPGASFHGAGTRCQDVDCGSPNPDPDPDYCEEYGPCSSLCMEKPFCNPNCGGDPCFPGCPLIPECEPCNEPICAVTLLDPWPTADPDKFVVNLVLTLEAKVTGGEPGGWIIFEGEERVTALSPLNQTRLVLRLEQTGPVTVIFVGKTEDDCPNCSAWFVFEILPTVAGWCEDILAGEPFNMDPFDPELDTDGDGLYDWEEVCIYGTNPYFYDTDGDGLPDGWEVMHGLNPHDPSDAQDDPDEDGLTNFEEYMYGTDPFNWDTDGDGVSDGQEVAQGSDPLDANDSEPPDPEDIVEVTLQVGDHSGSHSEFWALRFTRKDTGTVFLNFLAPGYGKVTDPTPIKFRRGRSYDIELIHHGSNCGVGEEDYDYTAHVTLPPDACGWVDDPQGLLGVVNVGGGCGTGPSPNLAEGKVALLHLPKLLLSIDSDNNNGYDLPDGSEYEEQIKDDPDLPGKLIPVNTGNIDEDSVPDFADGYNLDGVIGTDDDVCEGNRFVPMVLEIGEGLDFEAIVVSFDYEASDPAGVIVDGSRYEPAPGHLRIWTQDGGQVRHMNSVSDEIERGDYVPPGAHTAEALGVVDGKVTLYVEGIAISDGVSLPISVQLEHDGLPICDPDTVHVRLFDLEHVAFDDETGEEYPAESVTGPSDLTPELTIEIVSARLLTTGEMEVDIQVYVKDRLSELADDPAQRLQEVRFFVNGQYHSAVSNLPAMSPGSGTMPWQPYLLDATFTTTLTIDSGLDHVRPGGYVIDALTSPNAAGRTAKSSGYVTVQWIMLEDLFQAPIPASGAMGLTVQFMIPPTEVISDWAWVYFGDRDPLPSDGIVAEAENEPDSWRFEGELLLENDNETVIIDCVIEIDGPITVTSNEVDTFTATVTYDFEDGGTYTTTGVWIETSAGSLRFIQDTPLAPHAVEVGDDPEGGSYFLPMIVAQGSMDSEPEGPNGFMERTLVRVVGLGEDFDAEFLSGMVNDVETPLAPFTYSPTKHYFVHEQQYNRPRIFVVTIDPLPAGIKGIKPNNLSVSNETINELRKALHIGGHDAKKYVTVDLFEDDFGTPQTIGEPPEGPLTMPVLLTYFQLLYGETGLQLLQFYQNAEGGITIKNLWFKDWRFRYYTASAPYNLEIEIEESLDPVTAASYLYAGLNKALSYNIVQQQIEFTGENFEFWKTALQQRAAIAAEYTAAAAKIYLYGVAAANIGSDIVFTINELNQGHWEAAVGFIPFIPAAIGPAGRAVLKTPAGNVLATFDAPIVQAIKQAKTKKTFAEKWQLVQAAGATPEQLRILVRAGQLPPAKDKRGLRRGMLGQGNPPSQFAKPQAHHELPWAYRDDFAAWGFDVNDPQFGKWVEGAPHGNHQSWSAQWNQEWGSFLDYLGVVNPSVADGQSMILGKLEQMRQGYLPGGPFPVP